MFYGFYVSIVGTSYFFSMQLRKQYIVQLAMSHFLGKISQA